MAEFPSVSISSLFKSQSSQEAPSTEICISTETPALVPLLHAALPAPTWLWQSQLLVDAGSPELVLHEQSLSHPIMIIINEALYH